MYLCDFVFIPYVVKKLASQKKKLITTSLLDCFGVLYLSASNLDIEKFLDLFCDFTAYL